MAFSPMMPQSPVGSGQGGLGMGGYGSPGSGVMMNNPGDAMHPSGPSACVDGGPCGIAHLCFEPEGTMTNENWKFVGNGKGGYSKMQTYNYVGDGSGQFSKQVERADWGKTTKQICQGFMIVLGIAGVIYLVYNIMTAPKEEDGDAVSAQLTGNESSAAHFVQGAMAPAPPTMKLSIERSSEVPDCEEAFFNWRKAWTLQKKDYCCEHYNRGCTTPQASDTSNSSSLTYNCEAGYNNWINAWSTEKKDWCCRKYSRGCTTSTTTGAQNFDCQVGGHWSMGKRVFCCLHFRMGCPRPPQAPAPAVPAPAPTGPPLTLAGPPSSQPASPEGTIRPVPVPLPAPAPVPAHAPVAQPAGCDAVCTMNGVSKSCRFLIQFAATHKFALKQDACPLAHAVVRQQCGTCSGCMLQASGCNFGTLARQPVATQAELAAATSYNCQGCERQTTTTSPQYDCLADFNNWQKEWASEKKDWCCQHEGKGCTTSR